MLDLTHWNPASFAFVVGWTALGVIMGFTLGPAPAIGIAVMILFLSVPPLLALGAHRGQVLLTKPKEAL